MERIKQALERARAERATVIGAAAPNTAVSDQNPVPATPAPQTGTRDSTSKASSSEVKVTYTSTRTFALKPAVLRKNRIVSLSDPTAPAATAYKMLRTQVLQHLRREGWNALAITSPDEHDGKTLTAVNLAISIAREVSSTVLLVDADLHRPGVARCFGYTPTVGLVDHLMDDAPISELLVNPGIERFVFIPGGKAVSNSSELLGSPRMGRLVDELKSRYPSRIVIFDLPPVLSADDALAFAPHVDAALLVVREGKTRREDVLRALEFLSATNVIGTVLNDSEDRQSSYGYR